ncbi:hypothetical protein C5167_040392 [Papaver somniferum]|uniref:Uncharacterized protein n=1 Tax=Papaver somniferum TaxID=3469 RepID=A0A4Y7IJ24_PAPSO|nr:hypothetical protein C5167_040392 [Papaver somniferum]
MIRDWSFCDCFGNKQSVDNDDDDGIHPVLLVTGMGGSIINSKDKRTGCEIRVWVRVLLANWELRKKALSIYNPKTGYTESLDKNCEIVVPDNDYGLYAIDILDPSPIVRCLKVEEMYQFHNMINMLVECGYKKGATLFGYGYDFRQSNRLEFPKPAHDNVALNFSALDCFSFSRIDEGMEGLKAKLENAYKASGGRKVNLISHSMGGLLVSCFLSLYHDLFEKYVNKWICIACPFQGAPCINEILLTGFQFLEGFENYFFISRWTMHQLLVECPSIYEMLPNPEFKWKKEPQIQVWRKQSQNNEASVKLETYGPKESITVFEEALKYNKLNYSGKSIPLPFNKSILKWASGTREILNKAQLPASVKFYNIFGASFESPFDVRYGTKASPIEDMPQICNTMPQYSFVNGDGTVPLESAKGDWFSATERVGVRATHRGLLSDETVFQLIQQWLGVEPQKSSRRAKTSKVVDAFSK